MSQENKVLCGANSYEEKYFFNPEFAALPSAIKDELKVMCVLFVTEVGGILLLEFERLISDLQGLRHDPRNPNDAAREPHGVTHGPDALRYFAQTYLLPPGKEEEGEMEAYRRALWG